MHEHSAARQLDDAIHQEIKAHCAQGDAFVDSGEFEDALAAYNKAWVLVPDPKNDWEASTWILAAIGDLSFQAAWPNSGRKALEYAMTCPGGLGNPFMHLRLGQIKFDAGDLDGAADELMRAYMGGAEQIFEQDDPKYLAFLRTRAKI